MVRFIPFALDHLKRVNVQPQQTAEFATMTGAAADALTLYGVAMTALAEGDGETRVLACAGLIHKWRGVATLWAIVGRDSRPQEWTAIVRKVRSSLDAAHRAGVLRIEASADAEFLPAQRLLTLLGFDEPRAWLRAFSPRGRDCWLYARVRVPLDRDAAAIDRELAA